MDSVTGVAGAQVECDSWGLDFVLTGSQKALALPPGLALGVAQPAALERARAPTGHLLRSGRVRELHRQEPDAEYSGALPHVCPGRPGRANRGGRHRVPLGSTPGDGGADLGLDRSDDGRGTALEVLAPLGYRSPTVTCIKLPSGMSGTAVDKEMKRRGYTISPGYGALKDSTIRIGHMGDHTVDELNELLQVLEDVMRS